MKKTIIFSLIIICFSFDSYYPIDGYELTGIRRLAYLERVKSGDVKNLKLPEGALRPLDSIKLRLANPLMNDFDSLPSVDPVLQDEVDGLFRGLNKNYSLTILDMSDNKPVRFAKHRESVGYQPGSVGKLVVLASFFTQLAKIYPDDFEARRALLKTKMIKAGPWALSDHHTVPFYDLETEKYTKRTVRASDVFSLYEWLDNMVSVSNNGAASVVWREAFLMCIFGKDYPALTYEEGEEYFKSVPRSDLSEMAINMVNNPLRELGISEDEWRLGKFFTSGAGNYIPGMGGSIGTPIGLIKFVIALEKGEIVDKESSLEMKRILYLTDRRIRYAASTRLDKAAVFFKSGSFYSCRGQEESEDGCGKYAGTVFNYMNSVAIVEHPDGTRYAVCLMSNVLGKNSAWDHLTLATRIDKLMHTEDKETE
ncbi:serine hydrolase [Joostella sp.]|uniref:serine hydrolase n=1 Tax=Joostella sp. TaxID=2231138 RepID=UPI003A8CD719